MNRIGPEIREAQEKVADMAGSLEKLFEQIDGFVAAWAGADGSGPADQPEAYMMKLTLYLTRLQEALSELSRWKRLLEEETERSPGDRNGSVQLSLIQAEQMLLATGREAAVLEKSLDGLRTLKQAWKQAEDVKAVKSVKRLQDALRRYGDEQEKNE